MSEITDECVAGADLYNGTKLVRHGRPKLDNPRQLLSLRLPPQVIARWQSTGPGWQSRMSDALEKSAPKSKVLLANKSSKRTAVSKLV